MVDTLIAASEFVNSVTERVRIARSAKLRAFLEYKYRPKMNTQAHAVMMMGITMMTVMMILTAKVKSPVLTAHKVTRKRKGTVF